MTKITEDWVKLERYIKGQPPENLQEAIAMEKTGAVKIMDGVIYLRKEPPYVGKDKGRWPKGTRVRKICSKPEDSHQNGALGIIVGAWGPLTPGQRAEVIIKLAQKGMDGDIEYFYWVIWDDIPGIPVGIADCRIEPIEELGR